MNFQRFNITQAVILAGGRGERLRPLTDTTPKPMVRITGRPFLEYLCEQLFQQGFTEVVILAGYLGHLIEAWAAMEPCGPTHRIRVISTPPDFDPLDRLRDAELALAERFLLMYGDNFTSLLYDKIRLAHAGTTTLASVLVSPKMPGNIQVNDQTKEVRYLSKRDDSARYVELGFMAVEKAGFFNATSGAKTLKDGMVRISANDQLAILEHGGRYYSVSDPERYRLTAEFLTPKKIVLLDRDGTLNARPNQGEYLCDPAAFALLPEAVTGLRTLAAAGFSLMVVSNQAGVSTGALTRATLDEIDRKMKRVCEDIGANIVGSYYCTAHWQDRNHPDRKPNPGMFHTLSREHHLRLDNTFYIGDDPRDVLAAWNANCLAAFIGPPTELRSLAEYQQPKIVGPTLADVARELVRMR